MDIPILHAEEFFPYADFPFEILESIHNGHTALHTHDFYELVFLEQGFTLHACLGRLTVLLPGDMFVIRPMEAHEYIRANQAILYNCLFHKSVLAGDIQQILQLPGIHEIFDSGIPVERRPIHLAPEYKMKIERIIHAILEQQRTRHIGWQLTMKSGLIGILVLYAQCYSYGQHTPHANSGQTSHVYRALEYIEQHNNESMNVSDIAEYIGITTDYLTKCFKNHTGITPVDYIKYCKLTRAVELLKNPAIPIAQAAAETGYDDHAYFSRLFKRLFGVSPSEFRKSFLHFGE